MKYQNATKCIHLEDNENLEKAFGAVSFPIYQTATFAHKGVGESTGYDYSRMQNPTREQLEKTMAALEKGTDAIGFSSGMAAIAAVMELFVPGDHVIIDADLYGGSVRLFQNITAQNGIIFSRVDLSKGEIDSHLTDRTKAVFLETPTNPMMHVTDLIKLSKVTKPRNILLIVDNTFLSPYFQNPLELGADIVIHSGTKYLNGHNDAIAGFTVVKEEGLKERLRYIFKTVGSCLSPFDSWLILRGIKTLAVRMEKAQENALLLAGWLKEQRQVKKVFYPGLPEHPGYDIMKKQCKGYGAMISFEVESPELAKSVLNRVQLLQFAESLGGVETLITYPIMQTHADVPADELAENGINDRLLRISVGIEDGRDLMKDLQQAFSV